MTEVGFWSIKIESLLLLPPSPQKNRVTDFVVVGEPEIFFLLPFFLTDVLLAPKNLFICLLC